MTRHGRGVSVPQVVLFCLAVAVGVTLLFGGLTSAAPYGAYNTGPDGTSTVKSLVTAGDGNGQAIHDASVYGTLESSGAVSFVLAPTPRYGETASTRLERFVRRGGTLVVAADSTNGSNQLLTSVGADARVTGDGLRDERHFERDPSRPRARNPISHPYTDGVGSLVLDNATVVSPNGATILVNSSSSAYLDTNGNERRDGTETSREYPVVTSERVGNGTVITVADSSVFANSMVTQGDNRRFARNLADSHSVRLLDVSGSESLPPLVSARTFLRGSPVLQVALGFVLIVLLSHASLWPRLRRSIRSRGQPATEYDRSPDGTTIERWVRDQHPDWDQERVRRVAHEIARVQRHTESATNG